MRVLRFILTVGCLITFSTQDAFSHGEIQNKNKCSWGWEYKAIARVNNGPGITRQATRGCGGGPFGSFTASVSNPCAWQTTTNTYGVGTYSGAVTATPWFCGRGFANSDLFYNLNLDASNNTDGLSEEVNLKHDPVEFSKHKAVIPNINGFMFTNAQNVFSSLEIIVWKPSHNFEKNIEDSVADVSEYLWQGKIELMNGEVSLEGSFPYNAYQLIRGENGGYKVVFNNENIEALLPEGIHGEDDEIIVSIITDGGMKEKEVLEALEVETFDNANLNLTTYPNPTSDLLNVEFNLNETQSGTIQLYNISGKLISTLFDGQFDTKNTFTFSLNNYQLPAGNYFVLIKTKEENYLNKITVK